MATAENQAIKSKRDLMGERLRKKYPDREFADDEAMYSQINDDYDDYDSRLEGYRKNEKALGDLFRSDPRSAAFLQSWRDKRDPAVAFLEMFGDDIIEAVNDPEKMDEMAEARKKYAESVAQEAKNEEEYKSNLAQSLQALAQWQQERGMSDDELDAAMEQMFRVANDAVMGKFDPANVELFVKGGNYDAAVTDAAQVGEARGRNAKISEQLRRPQQGDGTAQLAPGGLEAQPRRKRPSIFEEAELAK